MGRIIGRDGVATRPLGVIDTLTAGYETINRALWLLLFPISLDLCFWLGPKFSLIHLAGFLPPTLLQSQNAEQVTEALAQLNLLFLLALHVPTVLGKVLHVAAPANLLPSSSRAVFQVMPEQFLILLASLLPLGVLIGAFYLGGVGRLVRTVELPGNWLTRGLRYWARLVLFYLTVIGAMLLVLLPLGIVATVVGAMSAEVGSFLLLLFQVAVLWAAFYLYFAVDALIVADVGPIQAAMASIAVVRRYFWSAAGFIALILIINNGLPLVWRSLAGQPLGLVASIVGNAYVGTGLVAASMLFFRDRFQVLRGQPIGNA